MTQYISLRDDGQPIVRTTIADAIDMLRADVGYQDSDSATIRVGGIRLPSGRTAGLVCVIFKEQSSGRRYVVRLRSANYFRAFERDAAEKRILQLELLDGAKVDGSGSTLLSDGRRIRAIEVIPEPLPYELSDLDWKITHLTISMIGAKDRCYRSLRFGVPKAHQAAVPDHRFLDLSTFISKDGQPPLGLPLLKQIRAEFINRYPETKTPSEQKISDALAKVGLRTQERRPRSPQF